MIAPVNKINSVSDYDVDNGQPYNIETGKDADIDLKSFAEILREEMEG